MYGHIRFIIKIHDRQVFLEIFGESIDEADIKNDICSEHVQTLQALIGQKYIKCVVGHSINKFLFSVWEHSVLTCI